MSAELQDLIDARIDASGGITVAEYMELALYHPRFGYYASRAQRSGRGGDFYTSVDAGALFGACIAQCLHSRWRGTPAFDLVEAGAGNGRLSRDILDTAASDYPDFYAAIRLHLVERSPAARDAQRETLGPHAPVLASSGDELPSEIRGAIVANELLDAMPCHLVEMTADGLRELYVGKGRRLAARGLSDPAIAAQLARAGVRLDRGWRAEVSLAAAAWMSRAARALASGALLIFDYGHEARELYSAAHASGTLVRYASHRVDDRWLDDPGDCDLTAHVDFTTARLEAEAAGLRAAGFSTQSRFLIDHGITDRLPTGSTTAEVRQRLRARTLIAPEGLGGTMKVMQLERGRGAEPRAT